MQSHACGDDVTRTLTMQPICLYDSVRARSPHLNLQIRCSLPYSSEEYVSVAHKFTGKEQACNLQHCRPVGLYLWKRSSMDAL